MGLENVINDIKNRVSITDVFSYLGCEINGKGFACCPFHNEKEPSLKVYEKTNSFHCFGCGLSGDVVDAFKNYYKTDLKGAIKSIDECFNLGLLTETKPKFTNTITRSEKKSNLHCKEKISEKIHEKYLDKLKEFEDLKEIIKAEKQDKRWFEALQKIGQVEHDVDRLYDEWRSFND